MAPILEPTHRLVEDRSGEDQAGCRRQQVAAILVLASAPPNKFS
jgi:hypothetical protein